MRQLKIPTAPEPKKLKYFTDLWVKLINIQTCLLNGEGGGVTYNINSSDFLFIRVESTSSAYRSLICSVFSISWNHPRSAKATGPQAICATRRSLRHRQETPSTSLHVFISTQPRQNLLRHLIFVSCLLIRRVSIPPTLSPLLNPSTQVTPWNSNI